MSWIDKDVDEVLKRPGYGVNLTGIKPDLSSNIPETPPKPPVSHYVKSSINPNDLISEEDFQNSVIELAQRCGWKVHAERKARTEKGWCTPIQGDAGFPDLVLSRGGIVIFAECKSEKGKLSVEQKAWAESVDECPGVLRFTWLPHHWDEIVKLLK